MTVLIGSPRFRERLHRARANTKHLSSLGVLEVSCLECGGDGDWGKFIANDPELCRTLTGSYPYKKGSYKCVDCKGTGKVEAMPFHYDDNEIRRERMSRLSFLGTARTLKGPEELGT